MKQFLSSRQLDVLACSLGIAAADQHNLDWLNRVLKGTKSKTPATREEVDEVWRIIQYAVTVEVERSR